MLSCEDSSEILGDRNCRRKEQILLMYGPFERKKEDITHVCINMYFSVQSIQVCLEAYQ